jgi:hypothetical protein
MNFLFHIGVGNLDRPYRWKDIGEHLTNLANSLETLGHDCLFYVHSTAVSPKMFSKYIVSDVVKPIDYNPDYVITWNGISEGDQQIVKLYGIEKVIFGELGFFNHYHTCYFDLSGTNYKSMNIVEDLKDVPYSSNEKDMFNSLVKQYKKPRIYQDRYVFVPLQDETDTQITKLSPFKTMYELLEYVIDLYNYDPDIKIIFKKHPMKPCKVPSHHKLLEVTDNVHHYLPYAENIIGYNSTVLFETLLYHQRLLTVGIGIASRRFETSEEREKFIINTYSKQINLKDLGNVELIKKSWLYRNIVNSL